MINVILFIYAFSVVYGRLYTAMHSFTDCIAGIILGAGTWWAHTDWAGIPYVLQPSNPMTKLLSLFHIGTLQPSGSLLVYVGKGLGTGKWIEGWIEYGGWEVPLTLIPLCLLAVHHHPQPVDDCPCFEDAIAILSVVLGAFVSRWAASYIQLGTAFTNVVTPGSGWVLEMGQWVQVERGWNDVVIWWTIATVKMTVGMLQSNLLSWPQLKHSPRHIDDLCMAIACQICSAHHSSPNLPSPCTRISTPAPSFLYPSHGIQECSLRIPFSRR